MMVQRAVTIAGQFVFCWLVVIVFYIGVPIGNGWELIVLPVFFAIECVLVGWLVGQLFGNPQTITPMLFVGPLLLSVLGAAILNIPRAWGFQGLLFPILGALIGYQLVQSRA